MAEQQQLGYMPLRDDYDIERPGRLERLISGLSVNYDDEDLEIGAKARADVITCTCAAPRAAAPSIAKDYNLGTPSS